MSHRDLFVSYETNRHVVVKRAKPPTSALIAFRDQTPGVAAIYIQDVAVSPDHRRQGHGEALLQELHWRAHEWSIRRLWLTSEAENAGAMGLWTKLGYVNSQADYEAAGVWLTRDLKGPGRDRAVFELRISEP